MKIKKTNSTIKLNQIDCHKYEVTEVFNGRCVNVIGVIYLDHRINEYIWNINCPSYIILSAYSVREIYEKMNRLNSVLR